MQALIVQSHWHLMVFYVALAICYVPEWIGSFFQNPRKDAVTRDRGSYALIMLTMFAAIILAVFAVNRLSWATIGWRQAWVFWAGIVCILTGFVFRWYAIKVLGKFFTRSVATRPGQYVVDVGPYRLIRHPSYSGALLSMLGMALAMTNWLSIVFILVGALIGYGWRVHVEEQALCSGLGQPYRDYMLRTRRFVPFVW